MRIQTIATDSYVKTSIGETSGILGVIFRNEFSRISGFHAFPEKQFNEIACEMKPNATSD